MGFILYHKVSTVSIKWYATESGAKRGKTCSNRNAGHEAYDYASQEDYKTKVVYTKTVKNLMSGKDVEIPSNTPLHCDPSSETYWSM
jgi:hypothetical protein